MPIKPELAISEPAIEHICHCAAQVRVLVLDIDGVCTNGVLLFGPDGKASKAFNSQDGLGIKTALKAGLEIGVISGRDDAAVRARMNDLGVREYHPGFSSKLPCMDEIRQRLGLEWAEMAFLGDDWIDLDPMLAVGMPMAVANARPEVKNAALFITAAHGGHGAVREAIEWLLRCRPNCPPLESYWLNPRP